MVYMTDSGKHELYWQPKQGISKACSLPQDVSPGAYNCVVVTYSGSTSKVYLNGLLKCSETTLGISDVNPVVGEWGGATTYSHHDFVGKMKNLRRWDVVLNDVQIQDMCQQATTTTTTTWLDKGAGACTNQQGHRIKVLYKHGGAQTEDECKTLCASKSHCIGFSWLDTRCHLFGSSYDELRAESPELASNGWISNGDWCSAAGSNCVVAGANGVSAWGTCYKKA